MPHRSRWKCLFRILLSSMTLLMVGLEGCEPGLKIESSLYDDFADEQEADPEFQIPSGGPEKILEFAQKVSNRKPQFVNEKQQYDNAIKTQKTLIRAGDAVLVRPADEKLLREAAGLKLQSTLKLVQLESDLDRGTEALVRHVIDLVQGMRKDSRPVVAKVANDFWVAVRSLEVKSLSSQERTELADESLRKLNEQFTQQSFGQTFFVIDQFLRAGDYEHGSSLMAQLAEAASHCRQRDFQMYGPRLKDQSRFLRMCGKPIELEGQLLNGAPFDWTSYRGKVVLVDFWATWCGPCLDELQNVRELYERYHARGFDVIGISLDRDRKVLTEFVNSEKIPWDQLCGEPSTDSKIRPHPMVVKYGISSIPRGILVDPNGIVVSVEARGRELVRFLEKMLGRPAE